MHVYVFICTAYIASILCCFCIFVSGICQCDMMYLYMRMYGISCTIYNEVLCHVYAYARLFIFEFLYNGLALNKRIRKQRL
jgi:hypothetical protein